MTPPPKKKSGWLWACGGCGCLVVLGVIATIVIVIMIAAKENRENFIDPGLEINTGDDTWEIEDGDLNDLDIWDDTETGGAVAMEHQPPGVDLQPDEEPDPTDLVIYGPSVDGGYLEIWFLVSVFDDPVTLEEYAAAEIGGLDYEPDTQDPYATLAGVPAHMATFAQDGLDMVVISSVVGNAGISVLISGPTGSWVGHRAEFDTVLNTLAIYE